MLYWSALPNPFSRLATQSLLESPTEKTTDTSEIITGHVSGRRSDIIDIVTGVQSAILMTGASQIGKSTLLRYLARPPQSEWSWRDELADLRDQWKFDDFHFIPVELSPLEEIERKDDLLLAFARQCAIGLLAVNAPCEADGKKFSELLRGINQFLRDKRQETPFARFFLVIDTLEYVGKHDLELSGEGVRAHQNRGLTLLDQCGALRMLVDLIDEFNNFGVLLSTQSLPRPSLEDQFKQVSADLARFATTTLQIFTWEDAQKLVAQHPESFGTNWAKTFRAAGESCIFTDAEQQWILEQAGTHPYLLHQYCLRTFRYKQQYASQYGKWTELKSRDQDTINEYTRERLSIFLAHFWQRLQEALDKSTPETRRDFYDFIHRAAQKQADETMSLDEWHQHSQQLRYILYNEGVVRSGLFQPVHFPGAILSNYLLQKVKERALTSTSAPVQPSLPARGSGLIIRQSHESEKHLPLTETEFRLMKTLLEHAQHCTEEQLITNVWGKPIGHTTFTQRLFHLRKKLKECAGEEIIENHYGGIYTLNHPDWFTLE
ncbi:MAG TPA: winged helix-turn-helix domain-containing protein [Ktedonobacteraceae bacterium]|nr:winged helix-turn-helix domain-containing protein [Ktedonobacteraceae bacterium]